MKKIILILSTFLLLCGSCQKRRCKEQQTKELLQAYEQYTKEISNSNLTQQQRQNIIISYQEKQKQILAECN